MAVSEWETGETIPPLPDPLNLLHLPISGTSSQSKKYKLAMVEIPLVLCSKKLFNQYFALREHFFLSNTGVHVLGVRTPKASRIKQWPWPWGKGKRKAQELMERTEGEGERCPAPPPQERESSINLRQLRQTASHNPT